MRLTYCARSGQEVKVLDCRLVSDYFLRNNGYFPYYKCCVETVTKVLQAYGLAMLRKRETRRIFSERIARGNAASTCCSPNYRIAVREKETGSGNTAELKDKLLNEISHCLTGLIPTSQMFTAPQRCSSPSCRKKGHGPVSESLIVILSVSVKMRYARVLLIKCSQGCSHTRC